MKLEPVAWLDEFGNTFPLAAYNGGKAWRDSHKHNWKPLVHIPEGYVVVPVSLLKRANAAMMEWAAKYGEHNPQWLPPARVSELSAEIEAMIAAKEQS